MFAAARCALGSVQRRALELGGPIPVMESYAETGGGDSTTRTVTAPAGIVEDDVLVCHVGIDGNGSSQTLTPPSDTTPWIEITQGGVPNQNHFSGLWYKVVTAVAEPGSYMWTSTDNELWGISVARFSGCDTTAPITNSGTGFSVSRRDGKVPTDPNTWAPLEPIYCTRSNILLYHCFSSDNNFTTSGITPSSANGEVLMFEHVHGGAAGTWHGNQHEDFPVGGGTGRRIWQIDNSFPHLEERATHLIGLQPPIEIPSFLLLEDGVSKLVLEDGSGDLKLE